MNTRRTNNKAKDKAISLAPMLYSLLFLLALLASWFLSVTAKAESSVAKSLETRVWTGNDSELWEIEKEVVRLIQVEPRSAKAHYLLAKVLTRLFSNNPSELFLLKQASDMAQQAIDLDMYSDVGFVALADILDMMGQSGKGLALLEEFEYNGLEPTWRVQFTRARLYADSAPNKKILDYLRKALNSKGVQAEIILPYVVAVIQSDPVEENHVKKIEEWNKEFPSPVFSHTLAISYADRGDYKKAHRLYQQLATDKSNYEAKINDAILLYKQLKRPGEAVKSLRAVLASKINISKHEKFMINAHLGAALVTSKKFVEADKVFFEAINDSNESLRLLEFIARVYRDAKAYNHLAKLISRISNEIAGSGIIYALLGETLSERLRKHDSALDAFAKAIILEPGRSDYYNGMGLTYYRMHNYQDALRLFVTAINVDPADATAKYNEACVLARLGRSDEALDSLQESVALDPRLLETAKSDVDFMNLKTNSRFIEIVAHPTEMDITPTIGH